MRLSTLPNSPAKPSKRSAGGSGSGASLGQDQSRPPRHGAPSRPAPLAISSGAEVLSLNEERRELVCSLIGLSVKLGLVVMAGVSLCRLATAYQERMDRQGELAAVLEIETAQLSKARDRFDQLFMVEGEQRLIREQSQWIAPNRLRVVWRSSDPSQERPSLAMHSPSAPASPERP